MTYSYRVIGLVVHVVVLCDLNQVLLHGQLWRRLHAQLEHELLRDGPNRVLAAGQGVGLAVLGGELVGNNLRNKEIRISNPGLIQPHGWTLS